MKKPSKTTVETIKTVIIAVLITSIVAFGAGMYTHAHLNADTEAKVKAALVSKSE